MTKEGKLAGYELRIEDAKGKQSSLDLSADGKLQAKVKAKDTEKEGEEGEEDDDD